MDENNEVMGSLECNVPASIDIEEMLVGRLTARQLMFVCIGSTIAYNLAFKLPNKIIGWGLAAGIAVLIYFLAFRKIKKYDRYIYEHWYYYYKYKTEQQIFINK